MNKFNTIKKRYAKITTKDIYGLDIETHGDLNEFYMGSIVSQYGTKVFYNQYSMIEYINEVATRNSVFFATNLQFDLFGLFECTGEEVFLDPQIRGSRIVSARYGGYKRSIRFCDTLSFLPVSVDELGKIVGIPKLEYPKALGKIPKDEKEKKELEIYNIRDSTITYKFMQYFQQYINTHKGTLKNTGASTAFHLWVNNFLDIELPIQPLDIIQFCFKGYYGGRTECFKRGLFYEPDTPILGYDINSMYPYVMKNYPYPNPNTIEWIEEPDMEMIDQHMGVSEVTIECPKDMKIPFLPYRDPENDRLIFPTGTFKGVYTHFELQKAVYEYGYKIHTIHKQLIASGTFDPFSKYVHTFYSSRMQLKKEGSPFEKCAKILLNSLYGRLGLKPYGNITVRHIDTLKEEDLIDYHAKGYTSEIVGIDQEWHYFKKELENITQEDINASMQPMIAMYVTSYARYELHQYLLACDPYYCDTDSVYSKKPLPEGISLGEMKLERKVVKGCFVRPKFYYLEEYEGKTIMKIKGISGLHKEDKKEENKVLVEDILTKKIMKIKQMKFTSFKQSNRLYNGKFYKVNEIMRLEKSLNLNDTKRDWGNKEFKYNTFQESKPIHIEEVIEKENTLGEQRNPISIPL